MLKMAVIGMGGRAGSMMRRLMELEPEIQLAAIVDPDSNGVRERLTTYQLPQEDPRLFTSIDELLDTGLEYDGYMIGTRDHLHTDLAIQIAPFNKPLLLEKPVAITWEQLCQLEKAYRNRHDSVVVSFPLRFTPLFTAALAIVRSGRLGAINQIQSWNYVNYGGVYFAKWYRNYHEGRGLWLQKATHDFDYLNLLAGGMPITIAAMSNRIAMGGDMPHELMCSACNHQATCMESPRNLIARGDHGGVRWGDHYCLFSRDIQNQDSGSALIQYDNGIQVSYAQNFLTRRTAEARGAIVTGYKGTLEFDWYTSSIRVTDHHCNRVDNIEVKTTTSHLGGDDVLLRMFAKVLRGEGPSQAPLTDGILSAAMCLAARESCRNQTFERIRLPGRPNDAKRLACTLVEP